MIFKTAGFILGTTWKLGKYAIRKTKYHFKRTINKNKYRNNRYKSNYATKYRRKRRYNRRRR